MHNRDTERTMLNVITTKHYKQDCGDQLSASHGLVHRTFCSIQRLHSVFVYIYCFQYGTFNWCYVVIIKYIHKEVVYYVYTCMITYLRRYMNITIYVCVRLWKWRTTIGSTRTLQTYFCITERMGWVIELMESELNFTRVGMLLTQ